MKNAFPLLFALVIICLAQLSRAQSVPLCDVSSCYTADTCTSTVYSKTYRYATVHNIYMNANANVDLLMDVYSPCNLSDSINTAPVPNTCTGCKRPFILLIHGGGFRSACRSGMAKECTEFAKRGYVAASIDYRLGWVAGDELAHNCNDGFCFKDASCTVNTGNCNAAYADSNKFAIYRALQDAHAAMRFIAHYASLLNIDTRYLYIGGQSAGSVAAVNLAFLSQPELNTTMPGPVSVLGRVDTVGNSYNDIFKIAGIYNNWGAVLDTSLIAGNGNRIPMIAFHGTDDGVVPYGHANFLSCPYYDSSYGSLMIYKRLTNLYPGLPVELFACKGGHGIFADNDAKALYRIQKAICFFRNAKLGGTDTNFVQRPEDEYSISLAQLQTWFPLNCGTGTLARTAGQAYEDDATISTGADNNIICHYILSGEKQVEINVFDMTGRKINAFKTTQDKGMHTYQTDAAATTGIYIVTVSFNGIRTVTQKVFVGY